MNDLMIYVGVQGVFEMTLVVIALQKIACKGVIQISSVFWALNWNRFDRRYVV
jgi:cytochrome c oxidase subunit IV